MMLIFWLASVAAALIGFLAGRGRTRKQDALMREKLREMTGYFDGV